MRELAVQASNGTLNTDDRATLDVEFQALVEEIDRIADQTDFNGISLLNSSSGTVSIQVGTEGGETISIGLSDMTESGLGILVAVGHLDRQRLERHVGDRHRDQLGQRLARHLRRQREPAAERDPLDRELARAARRRREPHPRRGRGRGDRRPDAQHDPASRPRRRSWRRPTSSRSSRSTCSASPARRTPAGRVEGLATPSSDARGAPRRARPARSFPCRPGKERAFPEGLSASAQTREFVLDER